MEENQNVSSRPVNPRRRKPTPMQIFKERYLPLIILALTAILLVTFVIGSIVRAVQRNKIEEAAALAAAEEAARISEEAKTIEQDAAVLAGMYDYQGAVSLIDGFSGNLADYPVLQDLRNQYITANDQLVTWDDPNSVLSLSFQMLIADPDRAFGHEEQGESMLYHYITTSEFSRLLEQLYANNYILVSPDDFVATQSSQAGQEVMTISPLRLPAGKKPLLLTQTNVNYDLFLVDSNNDMVPDAESCGFASRLVLDTDGSVTCEYIDAEGQTHAGAYDLIPILDDFIAEHPDFSYRGAKAIIALSGHEGLFGYRTGTEFENYLGTAKHDEEVAGAKVIANALIRSGYDLACYTYGNVGYGNMTPDQIQQDQTQWLQEITPIIGQTNTLVFAKVSDIAASNVDYSGDAFEFLKQAGYKNFIGFANNGSCWVTVKEDHMRHGRILVTGNNLINNAAWFEEILDPMTVLDMVTRDKYM